MKRSLEVLAGPDGAQIGLPRVLRVGNALLTVVDVGDGTASSHFVSCLVAAGAMPIDREVSPEPDLAELRVVIRASSLTADTRKRAVTLEAAADVVLGSARPAFATLLARSLLGDR